MALITCAECGQRVSQKAAVCPGCGAPVKGSGSVGKTLLAVVAAFGFGIAAAIVAGTVAAMNGYASSMGWPMLLAFAVGALTGWYRVKR